tara:strand:- start:48 stop:347 length:300 start_codon:yes stop_codon:yes gene_type:complete
MRDGRSPIDCAEQTKAEVQRHTESREAHKQIFEACTDFECKARALITNPPMYLMEAVEDDILGIAEIAQRLSIWAEKGLLREDKTLTELRAVAKEAAEK